MGWVRGWVRHGTQTPRKVLESSEFYSADRRPPLILFFLIGSHERGLQAA